MYRYPAWFALIFSIIGSLNAFIISSPTHNTISGIRPTLTLSSSSFNEDGTSPAQKKQEQMMESSSIAGAKVCIFLLCCSIHIFICTYNIFLNYNINNCVYLFAIRKLESWISKKERNVQC